MITVTTNFECDRCGKQESHSHGEEEDHARMRSWWTPWVSEHDDEGQTEHQFVMCPECVQWLLTIVPGHRSNRIAKEDMY